MLEMDYKKKKNKRYNVVKMARTKQWIAFIYTKSDNFTRIEQRNFLTLLRKLCELREKQKKPLKYMPYKIIIHSKNFVPPTPKPKLEPWEKRWYEIEE